MKKLYILPVGKIFLGVVMLLCLHCTPDDDTNNLYPEVLTNFDYTVNHLTKEVTFTNTSSGGNNFLWNFGDGTTSTEINPIHTYLADGTYTVTLTLTNVVGTSVSQSYDITIDINNYEFDLEFPLTFEIAQLDYAFINFGGAVSEKIDNPYPMGLNTSPKVAQLLKSTGAEIWAGSFLTLDNPIDFSLGTTLTMKVWSPKQGAIIKIKLENLTNGSIAKEVDAVTTTMNQWEILTYDFSTIDLSNTYQKVVVFCDFGLVGNNSTYYFDDIIQQ